MGVSKNLGTSNCVSQKKTDVFMYKQEARSLVQMMIQLNMREMNFSSLGTSDGPAWQKLTTSHTTTIVET